LQDLKRIGHVGRAWHTGQIAFDFWTQIQPIGLVLFLSRKGFGPIGNFAAFHDAEARGHCPDSTQRKHRSRRYRALGPRAKRHRRTRYVSLKIEVRFIQRLPDSIEIGLAVRAARRAILLSGHLHDSDAQDCDDGG
jgi:hypothetical protein